MYYYTCRGAVAAPCRLRDCTTSPMRWPLPPAPWRPHVSLDAIARGLTAFSPVKGRLRALSVRHAGRDITVVDDTYNANPDSMRAAIDVLAALPAPQLLVMLLSFPQLSLLAM